MTRRLVAVAMCVSLVAAALAAPLAHVHDDDHATDHHKPHAVHAHFSGHAAADSVHDPAVQSDEAESARYLQVYVAVAAGSLELPAALASAFELTAPAEAVAHRPIQVVHAHDPPVAASLGSRAPPPFLS